MDKSNKYHHIESLLIQQEPSDCLFFDGGEANKNFHAGEANCNFFPTRMTKSDSKLAKDLRKFMFMLLLAHVLFTAAEIVIYEKLIMWALWEIGCIYVNYYAIMSISQALIFVYCLILASMLVFSCMSILTIMGQSHWMAPLVYFAQLYTYGYGGWLLFGKLRRYRNRDPKTDRLTPENEAIEDLEKPSKKRKSKSD